MKEVIDSLTSLVISCFMGVLTGLLLGLLWWLASVVWQAIALLRRSKRLARRRARRRPTSTCQHYRIVQTADAVFVVERLHHFTVRGRWPWSARLPSTKWVGVGLPRYPFPFPTQAAALKWVCDKRIYPQVVKELSQELP